jgi:hypothetical protein
MIHIKKRVKYFLLILNILIKGGITSPLAACKQQILSLNHFADVLTIPMIQFNTAINLLAHIVKLKILELKVLFILNKLFYPVDVYFIEFGNEARTYESVFETQSDFLAIREDELIQVIKNEFKRLWVSLIDLDDLRNATCIEWLVFYVTKVTKNFLDFILHQYS